VKALKPIDKETMERIKREREEEEAKAKAEKKTADEAEEADEDVVVPEGMKFVASKSGKKYYAVDSAQGKKIKGDNRVYFKDAAEAEAAGLTA
jgi:ribosomal protein L9